MEMAVKGREGGEEGTKMCCGHGPVWTFLPEVSGTETILGFHLGMFNLHYILLQTLC